ncbi:tripartite tricarboxylate transporter permease [Pararhodobacter sp. CCB-MM2]|uniref:tripartite tricarboxylate transporter permease n=1 Tax=Pararhodobacter sp. CCB-MM2 TaxID=1786003 RepID=UPI00082D09A0|nr:tripartite tricarboxylate transporter permease [Pararhodobacter sp. CCB-MM2]
MDLLTSFADHLSLGLGTALLPANLLYCFAGVFLGTLVGVLPGLGALITISLLLPFTYHLPVDGALIMLAGVYFGADFGGGTCSILLGVPGHPAAAVDVLDGYPMAKKGRGGVALFTKAVASGWGSSFGILLLMLFAPLLAAFARQFSPVEYTALMALGLMAAATVGRGSLLKGLAAMVIGLMIATVGTDVNTGFQRFTFGLPNLSDGISLIALAMGLFAVTEVILSAGQKSVSPVRGSLKLRDQLPTKAEWRRAWPAMLRGSGLGAVFGALPGTSGGMATFLSYAIEKKVSKTPEEFGEGAIEGLAAPEACNNAGIGTAMIPSLTLGIPGDAVMALLLAAMMLHGIQPGPLVMVLQPELFWGLIVSFWIGTAFLLILNIPLIGLWVRLLRIPYPMLFPGIVLFTCIGVYSTAHATFDLYLVLIFGLVGYALHLLRIDVVPLVLGVILGQPFEENLRRSLLLSDGDFSVFLTRPISLAALTVVAALGVAAIWRQWRPAQPLARAER